ncbi:MAG: Clp protease N-terminal domain-containing protein [Actinomycetota bacterium]
MSASNLVPTMEQLAQFIRQGHSDQNPLDQVAAAVELQVHLADISDRVVGNFVSASRRAGHSWSEIGKILGVTKQAVHHRHQSRWAHYRFSEEAELCFESAQKEAQKLKHNFIGTEHLLLGMLANPKSIAGKALRSLGLSITRIRTRVEELEGKGNRIFLIPTTLTPRARNVLDIALRTAVAFGYQRIYSGHIALSLIEAGEGIGPDLLNEFGIERGALEALIVAAMPTMQQDQTEVEAEGLRDFRAEAAGQPKIANKDLAKTIRRAREGDRSARQALIKHYLADAAALAMKHRPKSISPLQAVQEANLILMKLATDPPTLDVGSILGEQIRQRLAALPSKDEP